MGSNQANQEAGMSRKASGRPLSPQLDECMAREAAAFGSDAALGERAIELMSPQGESEYLASIRADGILSQAAVVERHLEYRNLMQDALAKVGAADPGEVHPDRLADLGGALRGEAGRRKPGAPPDLAASARSAAEAKRLRKQLMDASRSWPGGGSYQTAFRAVSDLDAADVWSAHALLSDRKLTAGLSEAFGKHQWALVKRALQAIAEYEHASDDHGYGDLSGMLRALADWMDGDGTPTDDEADNVAAALLSMSGLPPLKDRQADLRRMVNDEASVDGDAEEAELTTGRGSLMKVTARLAKAASTSPGLVEDSLEWMQGASGRDKKDFFDWLEDRLQLYRRDQAAALAGGDVEEAAAAYKGHTQVRLIRKRSLGGMQDIKRELRAQVDEFAPGMDNAKAARTLNKLVNGLGAANTMAVYALENLSISLEDGVNLELGELDLDDVSGNARTLVGHSRTIMSLIRDAEKVEV